MKLFSTFIKNILAQYQQQLEAIAAENHQLCARLGKNEIQHFNNPSPAARSIGTLPLPPLLPPPSLPPGEPVSRYD